MNVLARIKLRYFSDLEDRLDSFAAQFVDVARRCTTLRALHARVQLLEERPERAVEVGDLIARVRLLETEQERRQILAEAFQDLKPPNFTVSVRKSS